MKTIEELVKYCEMEKPVGALLLTGEWGCGKTYLIENDLKHRLEKTHIIVRISLFGIASIDEFHETIKNAWIEQTDSYPAKVRKFKKIFDFIGKFNDALPDDTVKGIAGGILSIDPTSFVTVSNKVGKKTVVLVFDDLERSRLNPVEVLGTIHEYCENQKFNIIIVAVEEKIDEKNKEDSTENDKISYKEIKEKVVQRTVYHVPDYKPIVNNLIEQIKDNEYKKLLKTKENELSALFAGENLKGESLDIKAQENIINKQFYYKDEKKEERANKIIKQRPHNIRSLRIAIQDFTEVYNVIKNHHVSNMGDWFISFVAFSMAARANILGKENSYMDNEDVGSLLYPGFFDSRFFPESLRKWVLDGNWEEEELCQYLSPMYFDENSFFEAMVKDHNIDQFDEIIARKGIPMVLQRAYKGELSFNQYVNLIRNSRIAREYGLQLCPFDWKQIQKGIVQKEQTMIKNGETEDSRYEKEIIGSPNGYTEPEMETYEIIEKIRNSNVLYFEKEKKDYLSGLVNEPLATIRRVEQDQLWGCFDNSMAEATYDAYVRMDNSDKRVFASRFLSIWKKYWINSEVCQENKKITKEGLSILKEKLVGLLNNYQEEPFKKKFTEAFIHGIQESIDAASNSSMRNTEE